MKLTLRWLALALTVLCLSLPAQAQKKKPADIEDDYYKLLRFELPKGEVLEAGAIEIMPDGRVAVGTRRGEIWMIDNAYADPIPSRRSSAASPTACTRCSAWPRRTAGSTSRSGPTCRGIKDTNGDGKADVFEVVTRRLGDQRRLSRIRLRLALRQGRQHLGHAVPDRLVQQQQQVPRLGRARSRPTARLIPTTSGVRSPGGVGFNAEGDVFYTDNQGPWNGACGLKHLVGRRLRRPSRQLQVVQGQGSSVPRARPRRCPRATAGS